METSRQQTLNLYETYNESIRAYQTFASLEQQASQWDFRCECV